MKNTILFLLMLSSALALPAQTLITPFGFGYENDSGYLSTSVGEVAVVTLLAEGDALAQGFQQPEIHLLEEPAFGLFIPSGLVQDDDGPNGTFAIEGLEEYPGNELFILNRWGDVLYHARPYENNWDGYYNGQPLPQATYFYILRPVPGEAPAKGNLYILKK
ncbi:MAG: gliding motility-associated C-terminal domain-containing protein [Lewinellaceae bacterium]|nr:gliding motility-associated C-terminal domain-containing protein [Lewinellaceae bacterium]